MKKIKILKKDISTSRNGYGAIVCSYSNYENNNDIWENMQFYFCSERDAINKFYSYLQEKYNA